MAMPMPLKALLKGTITLKMKPMLLMSKKMKQMFKFETKCNAWCNNNNNNNIKPQ